ncbi:FAD-dependent oxidoreductase [Actinokineospora sp. HUAS TT18]|uniref:FAD-dependent oxidoreductase n=1 Tax=Actinokineospora sp. HUAS TT18 TaxID=3447451 RepID=UPI003F527DC2
MREHAVVLGGSMGGLLAARVLADSYRRVTVIERDPLPDSAENRRGLPQGRHPHALLPRGAEIVGDLFPGLLDDLAAKGAPVIADYRRMHFSPAEHRLCPDLELPPSFQPSRPFLEAGLRARVREIDNVVVLDGHEVVGLTTTRNRERVTGVRFQRVGGDSESSVTADLVVDAMGRGARTPAWLEALGYDRPKDDEVEVDIRYLSRPVRLRPGAVPEQLTVIGPTPERAYGMALFAYEGDTWIVTVQEFGLHGSPDYDRMLDLIADIAPPHMVAALRDAEPLGDVVQHRFPANRRRRYEKVRRFPAGLLVFGDALCSFNPIYGQGMSVAALEAEALRECLRHGDRNLARRFFRAAAKPIGVAWRMAVGADLALPWVPGPRPLSTRLVNAYVHRLLAAAEHDPVVAARFMRVSAFIEAPPKLMTPAIMARVFTRRAAPVPRVSAVPARV